MRRFTWLLLGLLIAGPGATALAAGEVSVRTLPPVVALMRTLPYKLGLNEVKSEDNAQRDHSGGGAVLRALLRHEAGRIERGKSIPFGGSVLAVARAS